MSRPLPMRYRTGAGALVAVLVLVSVHLYTSVLGGTVGRSPLDVRVELATAGGLFEGSGVTHRGVRVGRVEEVRNQGGGVVARLALEPGSRVPVDTDAVVRTLSPAGEQFLDLQPDGSAGPYLDDGDVVPASRTRTPTTVARALTSVDGLMDDVDTQALSTTLEELRVAFEDTDDLDRVLTSGSRVVEVLDRTWPETRRILRNGNTVLRTGVALEDDLDRFATSARDVAAWLAEEDPTFEGYLETLPTRVEELRGLTSLVALRLPAVLDEMIVFADMTTPRDQHLRELLRVFPSGFDRFADAVVDGRLQTTMLVSPGEVCDYGADEPDPKSTDRRPLAADRGCPTSFPGQERGSVNAPLPEGR